MILQLSPGPSHLSNLVMVMILFSDKQVFANTVDPAQTADQCLYCLPFQLLHLDPSFYSIKDSKGFLAVRWPFSLNEEVS